MDDFSHFRSFSQKTKGNEVKSKSLFCSFCKCRKQGLLLKSVIQKGRTHSKGAEKVQSTVQSSTVASETKDPNKEDGNRSFECR